VINQKVAVQLLAKLGCRTDVVANGMEAIEATQRVSYDLVFMDCLMPEMDGFVAAREIRGREKAGQHVPIVAMTANAMKGDREKCLKVGMDDCISKPLQLQALADTLKRWGLTDAQRSCTSNFHISPLPQPR
jgi:CheY-like chemotaxis protein